MNNPLVGTYRLKKLDTTKNISDDLYITGTSLNYFHPESEIRLHLFDWITSKNFERAIIIIILLSSIQLALSNPLVDPNSNL